MTSGVGGATSQLLPCCLMPPWASFSLHDPLLLIDGTDTHSRKHDYYNRTHTNQQNKMIARYFIRHSSLIVDMRRAFSYIAIEEQCENYDLFDSLKLIKITCYSSQQCCFEKYIVRILKLFICIY